MLRFSMHRFQIVCREGLESLNGLRLKLTKNRHVNRHRKIHDQKI